VTHELTSHNFSRYLFTGIFLDLILYSMTNGTDYLFYVVDNLIAVRCTQLSCDYWSIAIALVKVIIALHTSGCVASAVQIK